MLKRFKRFLPFLCIVCFYLGINILFNFQIWKQVFIKEPPNTIFIQGESPIYEYVAEQVYQNIVNYRNPFTTIPDVLYPFGWNFALDDVSPIHGFYFLLLRPFLSIHQSLMFIVVAGIVLANLSMYFLLRLFKIEKKIAFLFGLVYGFTPFLSLRIGGHSSFTAIYLFPLTSLSFLLILSRKKVLEKILLSILLGILLTITILTNLYFTLILALLICFLFILFFVAKRSTFIPILKSLFPYLFIIIFINILLSLPWFFQVYHTILFRQQSTPPSLIDAVTFSSDLFGIFIPSYLNPFYSPFIAILVKKIPYFGSIFENFIYPGLLILIPYILILLFYKKVKKSITPVFPLFIISFVFWILTLGPYLHILGKNTFIPLPYLFLSGIPYLQMARAPGRFIVPFIFLGSIVAAHLLNFIFKEQQPRRKEYLFLLFLFIFFIDQSYRISPFEVKNIPTKIYEYLLNKKRAPLLEIPFTIRDGLDYLGDIHAVWAFRPQLLHKQPIFGAYLGRLHETTFSYYKKDALLGNLGKIIDREVADTTEVIKNLNPEMLKRSLDFFGVEYSILNTEMPYTATVSSILTKVGFIPILSDTGYMLLSRKQKETEFIQIEFGSEKDNQFLEQGWGRRETNGRWVVGNVGRVVFRLEKIRPLKLQFIVKALIPSQEMQVFINRQLIGIAKIGKDLRTYTFFTDEELLEGINTVTLRFGEAPLTGRTENKKKDLRPLAAFFTDIKIKEGIPLLLSSNKTQEMTAIDFSTILSEPFLLQGWGDLETEARWTEGKMAKALFYITHNGPKKLHLRAESIYKPQKIRIYLNNIFSGELIVETNTSKDYFLDVGKQIKQGINILELEFSHTAQFSKIGGNPNDTRELSLYVKHLALEE